MPYSIIYQSRTAKGAVLSVEEGSTIIQSPPSTVKQTTPKFDDLKQTTKDQIERAYEIFMGPRSPFPDRKRYDSHFRILTALYFLGVDDMDVEDLLAQQVAAMNTEVWSDYMSDPDSLESLKRQASNRRWGFGQLKAIMVQWMQGKNEDQVLEVGRNFMERRYPTWLATGDLTR